jgi:hypothetical protein
MILAYTGGTKMTEQNDSIESRLTSLIRDDLIARKYKLRLEQKEARKEKWWGKLNEKGWWRYLIHIPHGMGAAWALFVFPFVGAGWLVLIVVYQYLEDWRIEDKSYIDMRGYMIGYAIMSVIKIAWHFISKY